MASSAQLPADRGLDINEQEIERQGSFECRVLHVRTAVEETVRVHADMHVWELKHVLAKRHSLSDGSTAAIRLAHAGRILQDADTLKIAGVDLVPLVVIVIQRNAAALASQAPSVLPDLSTREPARENCIPTEQNGHGVRGGSQHQHQASAVFAERPNILAPSYAPSLEVERTRAQLSTHLPGRHGQALLSRDQISAAWDRAFPAPLAARNHTSELHTARPSSGNVPFDAARVAATDSTDATDAADAADAAMGDPTCRVCYCGAEAGRLFSPCRCRGTMRFIHVSCLNSWRAASANPRSFYRCEQCGYEYRIRRTAWAQLLEGQAHAQLLSVILLIAAAAAGMLAPGRPYMIIYRLMDWYPDPRWWWWGARCDQLVVGLALPGMVGLACSVHDAWTRHAGIPMEQQRWLAALLLSVAANGQRIARVLLLCGLLYSWARLAHRLNLSSRYLLARCAQVVLEVEAT